MKRMLVITMAGIMALSMTACAQQADTAVTENAAQTEENPVQDTEQETQTVGIANPWHDSTEEEANGIVPNLFRIPEGATNVSWSKCDAAGGEDTLPGELVQATFDLDRLSYTARAQVTGDDYDDISGMYYDWTVTDECTLAGWGGGNMKGNTYRYLGEDETIDVITWYDVEIGISYSLSTQDKDLDGFDIQAVAEQMYDETKAFGYDAPASEFDHEPLDITGCDTFTQIVDKLENGQGYANVVMGDEDVLLVASGTFDGDGKPEAIDADIYKYTDGAPEYLGFVQCGGTAYPLGVKDGMLYAGGNHFIDRYTIAADSLVIEEEAWETYDSDGNATYYHRSDIKDVGSDDNAKVADDSAMNRLYDEYWNSEIIEFTVVNK